MVVTSVLSFYCLQLDLLLGCVGENDIRKVSYNLPEILCMFCRTCHFLMANLLRLDHVVNN